MPLMFILNIYWVVIHPSHSINMVFTPLTNVTGAVISPLFTFCSQMRIVVTHSYKRATGGWHDIRLITEVTHYSFTSAVKDRGHVERTSLLFPTVESQLSERQVYTQFIHGAFLENHSVVLIVTDPSVRILGSPVRWCSRAVDDKICDEKPASWVSIK